MELSADLHERIVSFSEAGNQLLGENKATEALSVFEQALSLLPRPVEDWEASTWLFVAIADCHFAAGAFDAVRENAAMAVRCPGGLGNPYIHLRLGQAQYELGNMERAKDELARAFMGGGDEIFSGDDRKYWQFIREILRPPASEVE